MKKKFSYRNSVVSVASFGLMLASCGVRTPMYFDMGDTTFAETNDEDNKLIVTRKEAGETNDSTSGRTGYLWYERGLAVQFINNSFSDLHLERSAVYPDNFRGERCAVYLFNEPISGSCDTVCIANSFLIYVVPYDNKAHDIFIFEQHMYEYPGHFIYRFTIEQ